MKAIRTWFRDLRLLTQDVPSIVMALFVVSVVCMNLLASKEINTGLSWLALDCGLLVSWMSFLAMDMLTKRFGPKASIKLSLTASAINLLVCGVLFVVSKIPGNWSAFYDFGTEEVNMALNNTFGGTWYILLGSTIAFITSAVVNAVLNWGIGGLFTRNNFVSYAARSWISTLFAQFVDNFVFALIVSHTFFGWSMLQCVTCSATGCIVELLCEVIFSPIGYKVCRRWEEEGVGDKYVTAMHRILKEVQTDA